MTTTHGRKMDRERQTFELLQLLGDDVAEAVLSRLEPDRAALLRTGMQSDKTRRSTIGRQRAVLDEFDCFFQFALKALPKEPVANSESDVRSDSSDPNLNHQILNEVSKAESKSEADSINAGSDNDANVETSVVDKSSETTETPIPAPPALTGIPLLDLQTLSVHQIASALTSEQPKTCAILLSNLPAKLAGDVLSLLKSDHQKLVMKEMTKEQHAPEVLIERIAKATFVRAQQLPVDPPDTRNHADRVAEVLRSVPKAGRREMLAVIEEQDPDLAKSLLTRIYRFDDIAGLGKTVVQRILGEIDSTNLTTALFGAPQEVTDAIFANLSKRARQTIEEEMQFMSNLTQSRIQQARDSIAEVIARIDMESE
jgi:flagellar motor switch protein FliG